MEVIMRSLFKKKKNFLKEVQKEETCVGDVLDAETKRAKKLQDLLDMTEKKLGATRSA